jgi:hypothetical protein
MCPLQISVYLIEAIIIVFCSSPPLATRWQEAKKVMAIRSGREGGFQNNSKLKLKVRFIVRVILGLD